MGSKAPTEAEDLAILIRSLKTRKVKRNLLEVARSCRRLRKLHGSYLKVAKKISLDSGEMIREFEALLSLPPKVRQLIGVGKLKSVVAGYWISRMRRDNSEKEELASVVINKRLTAHHVRDIVSYANRVPKLSIKKCVEKVVESRKVEKHYLLLMGLRNETLQVLRAKAEEQKTTLKELAKATILQIVRDQDVLLCDIKNNLVIMRIKEEAFHALRDKAQKLEIKMEDLADKMISSQMRK